MPELLCPLFLTGRQHGMHAPLLTPFPNSCPPIPKGTWPGLWKGGRLEKGPLPYKATGLECCEVTG